MKKTDKKANSYSYKEGIKLAVLLTVFMISISISKTFKDKEHINLASDKLYVLDLEQEEKNEQQKDTIKKVVKVDNDEKTKDSQAEQLDEVVVVGYGTQKKINLTGAVTQIDAKVIEDRPIVKLAEGLQGAIAGLNITSSSGDPSANKNVNVRGFTGIEIKDDNINALSGGPLVVIDGVQGGDLNTINPNDVESISVIKDAAAAAVYGSSAPYGVILITTKQGKKGSKTQITYSSNYNAMYPIGLPKQLNSLDFARVYNETSANGGQAPYFKQEVMDRMRAYQDGTFKDETIANPTADNWLANGGGNANNDWFKILYADNSYGQQHNISMSGSNENTRYFVSAGYNKKEGIYRYANDEFYRTNLRVNLSTDVTKWLTFNLRSAYSYDHYQTPSRISMDIIAKNHPNVALYNPDGGISNNAQVGQQIYGGYNTTINDKPILTGEFVAKFLKGWSGTVNYTYSPVFVQTENVGKVFWYTNPSGAKVFNQGTYPNSIERSFTNSSDRYTINAFTNYDLVIKNHDFKFLAGFVQSLSGEMKMIGKNNYLYTEDVPAISTSYGTSPSVSDAGWEVATRGYFGRFNYAYNDRYLLELTGRYDGSSRFMPDVRWKAYPGVSVGWNVNKESFWTDSVSKFVNTLKFRFSWGQVGDQTNVSGQYPFQANMGLKAPTDTNWFFGGSREPYVTAPGLINQSLTWVTTTTKNFGVDMSFLQNRLTTTVEVYSRIMDDFIGPAEVLPSTLGTGVPATNSAAMRTDGWELSLGWKDKINDFNYSLRGMLWGYEGVVTKYANDKGLIDKIWHEGQKIGEIWGYVTDRYFVEGDDFSNINQFKRTTGFQPGDIKYVDLNGDGKIDDGKRTLEDPGDRKVIGNSTPKYSYSLFADASYKAFDFSFFLQGVGKRDVAIMNNMYMGITDKSDNGSALFTEHLDRWTPETPNGYFPRGYFNSNMINQSQTQTKYLINASYIRLKNIQLGYTIPINKILKINKWRVYASMDNIWTYSPMQEHSPLDPESIGTSYPLQRTISFGTSISL